MIGYLYIVTNKVNGKVYVGKTYKTIQSRWKDHCKKAFQGIERPLYLAIAKYGVNNFTIESLGQFEQGVLEDKEIQLIEKLNSFGKDGYNATRGGDGRRYSTFTDEEIITSYLELKDVSKVVAKFKSSKKHINNILNSNEVPRFSDTHQKAMTKACGRKVLLVELGFVYDSISDCARDLISCEITDKSVHQVATNISKVVDKPNRSYLGFTFTEG